MFRVVLSIVVVHDVDENWIDYEKMIFLQGNESSKRKITIHI